jgi:hypothetical protein
MGSRPAAPGFATPAVTMLMETVFSIACGGGKLNKKSGDAYVALRYQV